MARPFALLTLFIALSLLGPTPSGAQDATPAASPVAGALASSAAGPARPDLAAMALAAADLPPGFANVDERYFLDARGVSTFFASEGIAAGEIAALDLRAMYDSVYPGPDEETLYLYLAEFGSPTAVEAGFRLLEDEERTVGKAKLLAHRDLPGPGIGEAPAETTVAVIDFGAYGGPVVDRTEVAFRVGSLLVGVGLETSTGGAGTPGATPTVATPDAPEPHALRLVTDAATKLEVRIRAVEAGRTPSGVEPGLPPLVLPTDRV